MSSPRRRTLSRDRVRMGRILGVPGIPAARMVVPSAAPPVGAPALIAQLQAPSPTPDRFHQIARGETLSSISRAALEAYQGGMGHSGTTRLAYQHCIAAGNRWNRRHYGSSWSSSAFPEAAFVDGAGVARAFTPWNDDALTRLYEGQWPERGFDADGEAKIAGVGSSLGLLWLPNIDGFRFDDLYWLPVCGDLDPPPLLLDALQSQQGRI